METGLLLVDRWHSAISITVLCNELITVSGMYKTVMLIFIRVSEEMNGAYSL